jgi:DNA-binding transcriptional LysR family regulator
VSLFYRTSRRVELTPPGRVLLCEALRALDAVAAAARRTRRAIAEDAPLVVATKVGTDAGLLEAILTRYRLDPRAVAVEVIHSPDQRVAMLRDGRADAALLPPTPRAGHLAQLLQGAYRVSDDSNAVVRVRVSGSPNGEATNSLTPISARRRSCANTSVSSPIRLA